MDKIRIGVFGFGKTGRMIANEFLNRTGFAEILCRVYCGTLFSQHYIRD
ncbi:MAG: hypothetical protein H6Q69_1725 [Firmicutes bacterium]|nr:hypothetical protein [Bacillota bacterium]